MDHSKVVSSFRFQTEKDFLMTLQRVLLFIGPLFSCGYYYWKGLVIIIRLAAHFCNRAAAKYRSPTEVVLLLLLLLW